MDVTKLSNSDEKISRKLALAFAREFSELTGETPSLLYQWGKNLGLPVPRARQTFYSHLESDGWERVSDTSSTENCRMGSYPMYCQLRLRVVSLAAQFKRDKKSATRRQLIVLFGYETCSRLIHFRVYRGPDYEGSDHEDTHGIPLCEQLPVATVAAFVEECGRMVGLPLQRILFTQNLMEEIPPTEFGQVVLLSLSLGEVSVRKSKEDSQDNEVLCSFGLKLRDQAAQYSTFDGGHPFADWCATTNAKGLTDHLSGLVNRHNKETALPRLATARNVLESLLQKSYDAAKARHGSSSFKMESPLFHNRMMKYDYVLGSLSLHDVRFYKRQYVDFKSSPGDCSPVAG